MAKFDGNLISLYLHGMINVAHKGNVKDARDYLEHMIKIDKEGKDFWSAVYSLLKKLHKKELGENKMSKKEKENLDEGMILMSGLTPVMGPKLSLSMRGNKPDNFEFKGFPGQFDKDGKKVMDEECEPIEEEILSEAKVSSANAQFEKALYKYVKGLEKEYTTTFKGKSVKYKGDDAKIIKIKSTPTKEWGVGRKLQAEIEITTTDIYGKNKKTSREEVDLSDLS